MAEEWDRLMAEMRATEADRDRWRTTLIGLTPIGSEYADDPERCAKYVYDKRYRQHEMLVRGIKRARSAEAACATLALKIVEVEADRDRWHDAHGERVVERDEALQRVALYKDQTHYWQNRSDTWYAENATLAAKLAEVEQKLVTADAEIEREADRADAAEMALAAANAKLAERNAIWEQIVLARARRVAAIHSWEDAGNQDKIDAAYARERELRAALASYQADRAEDVAMVAAMREALEWYANGENWRGRRVQRYSTSGALLPVSEWRTPSDADKGQRARTALGRAPEEAKR